MDKLGNKFSYTKNKFHNKNPGKFDFIELSGFFCNGAGNRI